MARREGHHFPAKVFSGSAGKSYVRPHLRSGGTAKKHEDAAADAKLVKKLVKPSALRRP